MSLLALHKQLRFRPKAINYLLLVTQERLYIQTCALKRLVLSTSSIEVISSLSLEEPERFPALISHSRAFPMKNRLTLTVGSRNSFHDVCALHSYGRVYIFCVFILCYYGQLDYTGCFTTVLPYTER